MTRTTPEEKKGNGKGRGRPAAPVVDETVSTTAKTKAQPRYESGQEAFMRIATGRVNGILEKLSTLAKLSSGRTRYGYSDADVEFIRKTLVEAVNAGCDRLLNKPVKGNFSFRRSTDAGA